ncbi:hypothetical protein SHIRM173S_07667 [Streptomyces hirsutus]
MATTSLGSSTTQMTALSRRVSRQMLHSSSCAILPQVAQKRTFAFTSMRAWAICCTSVGSAWRMWKAIRWALSGHRWQLPEVRLNEVRHHAFIQRTAVLPGFFQYVP